MAAQAGPAGRIFAASGPVRVQDPALTRDLAATPGLDLLAGDSVLTDPDGQAQVVPADDSLCALARSPAWRSEIDQAAYVPEEKTREVQLKKLPVSKLKMLVNDLLDHKGGAEVKTPTAVASVRGT